MLTRRRAAFPHLACPRPLAAALLAIALLLPAAAAAETDIVVGTDGGPGGDGQTVSATADNPGEDNTADATGGNGGTGGTGTDGGAGGDATATTVVDGASSAIATAAGGNGGNGGSIGGTSFSAGDGGDGGDATASANLMATGTDDAIVSIHAQGGSGGDGGPGGNDLDSGGNGGDATVLDSTITSEQGSIDATLSAWGRSGGDGSLAGGDGGAANVGNVSATSTGGGNVSLTIEALGGSGGTGLTTEGNGGLMSLGSLYASSTSGDVSVEVLAQNGAGATDGSTMLVNAIDGDTTGNLFLSQQVGMRLGTDGDAWSELSKTTSSASLVVETTAIARGDESSPGDATAIASAINTGGDVASDADADAILVGGSATAVADADGSGASTVAATADASARTAGGDVASTATATSTGSGDTTAVAFAGWSLGGFTPTQAGVGGTATATAYASNAGDGAVRASATAWGRGGEGLVYGAQPAAATAEGHSTGGGDVLVDANLYTGSDGSDIVLVNAVSGSTSGLLELRQDVRAEAPILWRVQGGDVVTGLTATNPGGGDLKLVVNAQAATTRPETGVSDAVIGDVIGTSTTGANVDISVTAEGGWGSQGAPEAGTVLQENRLPGRGVSPAVIYGESNGGDVSVFAHFQGGVGGQAFPGIPGGDGPATEMIDVATGNTTGNLSLSQRADGGDGGGLYSSPFAFEVGGDAGTAYSEISKSTASESLILHSEARGGYAFGGTPATATAISDAFNSAGTATAFSRAIGGGDHLRSVGSADAFAEATARTTGDGHAVFVGGPVGFLNPVFGAYGGSTPTQTGPTFSAEFLFGDGGNGTSLSTGIAEGDSVVTVIDQAFGGDAGSGFSRFPFGPMGIGGNGGDASSTAVAIGAGTSAVSAESRATGGDATILTLEAGMGGNAEANASATGLGEVTSIATAVGGASTGGMNGAYTGVVGQGGDALAWASAEGASGFARAEATTGLGLGPQIHVVNEAQVGSRSDVVAQATIGSALGSAATAPGLEGMAFATANPHFGDVANVLAGNTALADVFATEPAVEMLMLGQMKGSGRGVGASPVVLSTDFEIVLSEDDVGHQLVLGAFDVSALGPIVELSFGIERNGVQIGATETFTDVADVLAFFADWIFQFDGDTMEGDRFGIHIDLEIAGDSMFGMGVGFAAIIPEPGTGSLLVFGLAVFGSVSRQRRRTG